MNVEDALKWIADLLEESIEDIRPETRRDEIPAWDSLGSLTLIAGMDETFDILLTDEDIQAMSRVGDVLEIIRKNGKLEEM